ncbi:Peroxisome chaperone and import receptor [Malassezia sp. CBS 17886]|nr:Peroxisome chaperone and import receptor [Malassezia sp. CBS 17886]
MAAPKPTADDVDDLDDVLDDFHQPVPAAAAPVAPAGGASGDATEKASAAGADADGAGEDPLSDAFVRELTNNMESFMSQLGQQMGKDNAASAPSGAGGGAAAEEELMAQFEHVLRAGGDGAEKSAREATADGADEAPKTAGAACAASGTAREPGAGDFQDLVQATMQKLKQSDESAKTAGAESGSNPLAGLGLGENTDLSQLLSALGGAGADGEMPDLAKMLSSMMEDLMNKEILYDPLKDMHARFPDYFASPKGQKLDAATTEKFKAQQELMAQIIAVFEEPGYEDKNPKYKDRISDLIGKLQDLGSPPEELLGEMPPELSGLSGVLGDKSDENCLVM